jgi:hypothetical protein
VIIQPTAIGIAMSPGLPSQLRVFDNRLRRYDSGNGRDIAYEQSRDKLGGLTLFR